MRTVRLRQALAELAPSLFAPSSLDDERLLAELRRMLATDELDANERVGAQLIADAADEAAREADAAKDAKALALAAAGAPVVNLNVGALDVRSLPERVHKIVRDRQGKPTGSVEVDVDPDAA